MKKWLKILLVTILVITAGATGLFFYIKSRPLPAIAIQNVDLTRVRDGSYTGEYKSNPVEVVVKVDVANQKITRIQIEKHECGLGKKAEKITKDIVDKQSLEVDTVSGATHSSKVILKAVEVALEKGRE